MLLYDTLRSGNAWKVRLMASLVGVPLERRTLSIDRGDLAQPAFLAVAPLGHVPVLRLPDGTHLAESLAILHYLAQGTPWWPDALPAQSSVLTWLSFEQDRHMKPLAQLRLLLALHPGGDPLGATCIAHARAAHAALGVLDTQLARQGQDGWVATPDHPSIADVALYPYTCMAPMGGIALNDYPAIRAWLDRMEHLPGYQALFPGQPERNLSTQEQP
ncbi:glutathione S-transferase family protein [Pigmentiphaga litoralis]|uniref:Glutathione S-transferase n=1 Tax=Pigmentiphaga litoralis TaxID=516702 RepID=A0A7Y9ISY7_9BURK|nr:glutathione S-transferase family protein [Pigmentiphaga litoralis]NYE24042.1 glutathione S-transferase [Pigmentiphaga litoralis]NYE82344.1 glutathione S-transferase [Pigmentiphaga litoralis]